MRLWTAHELDADMRELTLKHSLAVSLLVRACLPALPLSEHLNLCAPFAATPESYPQSQLLTELLKLLPHAHIRKKTHSIGITHDREASG